ncbi:MAG TPA: hypothetical protein VFY11_15875 [Nocardioidaceae bacterium]|nr:hypothetical protein [Nocardioidaceae bacterium]
MDDSFYDHPKVFDAPDCAVALWTRAGSWSARNLTDGFVPAGMPARLCDTADQAVQELLNRGLWRRAKGGYQFHDWGHYQPAADAVRSVREKRALAGRMGGLASGKARSNMASKTEANASTVGSQVVEPPTRPDPKNNKPSSSTATPSTDDKDFIRFWEAYPRRVGKGQARKAWATATKKADPERIIEAAGRFTAARGNQDPKFTPHPSTWLNGERWGDAPEPEPAREPAPVMPWDLWS